MDSTSTPQPSSSAPQPSSSAPPPSSSAPQAVPLNLLSMLLELGGRNHASACLLIKLGAAASVIHWNSRAGGLVNPTSEQAADVRFWMQHFDLECLPPELQFFDTSSDVAACVPLLLATPLYKARVYGLVDSHERYLLVYFDGLSLSSDPLRMTNLVTSLAVATWAESFVHDLCQPIHVVHNVADMLEMKYESGAIQDVSIRKYIDMLHSCVAKSVQSLEKAKSQFAELPASFEVCDFSAEVREFASSWRQRSDEPRIIQECYAADRLDIRVDRNQLQLLLNCLIELTYTGAGGDGEAAQSLALRTFVEAGQRCLEIRCSVPLCLPEDVLSSGPDGLLASAFWATAQRIATACLGRVQWLSDSELSDASQASAKEEPAKVATCHQGDTSAAERSRALDAPPTDSGVQSPAATGCGLKLQLPASDGGDPQQRLVRSVRRMWQA